MYLRRKLKFLKKHFLLKESKKKKNKQLSSPSCKILGTLLKIDKAGTLTDELKERKLRMMQ